MASVRLAWTYADETVSRVDRPEPKYTIIVNSGRFLGHSGRDYQSGKPTLHWNIYFPYWINIFRRLPAGMIASKFWVEVIFCGQDLCVCVRLAASLCTILKFNFLCWLQTGMAIDGYNQLLVFLLWELVGCVGVRLIASITRNKTNVLKNIERGWRNLLKQ